MLQTLQNTLDALGQDNGIGLAILFGCGILIAALSSFRAIRENKHDWIAPDPMQVPYGDGLIDPELLKKATATANAYLARNAARLREGSEAGGDADHLAGFPGSLHDGKVTNT